jgi:flagellar protein FlaJ
MRNIEALKENLNKAKIIIKEIEYVNQEINKASEAEKRLMTGYAENAKNELKKISDSIPEFIAEKKKAYRVELSSSERGEFMLDAGIEQGSLKEMRKKIERIGKAGKDKKALDIYKRPGLFVRTASRIFSKFSNSLDKKGVFMSIGSSLRKANMPYLMSTYISVSMFSAILSFFAALIIAIPLFLEFGYIAILAPILIPIITFLTILFYPASEISSMRMKIDDELPFAVMHMSAISSSGVEPSRVFTILAASPEYPNIRKEMRKIVNMINFYGYDLTTALKTTAKTTSSQRLSELLGGMAATISGGGDLRNYLDKIAVDTLNDYKLRRRKFITISETYADIYTGLLIAAPLMFMLILVLMNVVTGNIGGMSSTTLTLIGIGAIVLLNIGFLIFLEVSQPTS